MNKIVEKCVEAIKLQKEDIPDKVAIQAVHYVLALACGLRRITLSGMSEENVPLNYYGITFANSGRGKDMSVSIAMKMIEPIIDVYLEKLTKVIIHIEGASIPSVESKEGTSSGYLQERNILDIAKIGSTNIRVEELVSTLKSTDFEQVVNLLVESWQEGSNAARSFKSYVSPKVKFVPTNCLLYSSPEGFRTENNKSFQGFVDNLANGLARRSYIVFDESEVSIEEEPTEESLIRSIKNINKSNSIIKDMKEYLFDVINSGSPEITMSQEAELEIKKYEVKNKNIVSNSPLMKNAVKAEFLARAYKIRRLAGLYAFYNGSDSVSIDDVYDAIEWAEMLNKDLIIALNAETIAEKIYDYLSKVQKYSSQTDIAKYYKLSAKDFKDNIDEVYTVAYDNGSTLQSKIFDNEAKVVKYNIVLGKPTEPDNMICSASNNMTDFESLKIGYKQLPNLVKGYYGKNYSAGTFLNGKRNKDNYIKRQNLIIYDVDEGTSIEDAIFFLRRYRGFIATTKSHLKEKNGRIEERFRIVLVSRFEFNLDAENYKDTLTNFALLHNLEVDFPVIEPARLYYANPEAEIIFLDGEELVDLREYMPNTKEVKKVEKAIDYVQKNYDKIDNPNGLDRYFLMQTVSGNRNNNLFKYATALIDKKGFDVEMAKSKTLALNSMLPEPLDEHELVRTVWKKLNRM